MTQGSSEVTSKIPVPDEDGVLQMTRAQFDNLIDKLSEPCVFYLIEQAESYAEQSPKKFKKYTDHARMLMNWHRMKIENGYDWFTHKIHGPGYYKCWMRKDYEA